MLQPPPPGDLSLRGGRHVGVIDSTARGAGERSGASSNIALVAPAVFILLVMGIFPLLYAVIVSFQRLSLSDQITEFQGLLNYARVF